MHVTIVDAPAIPAELRQLKHWVNWVLVKRGGNLTKVPYTPNTRNLASTADPSTWRSFAEAVDDDLERGIGFVFAEDSGYVGSDYDHSYDPETGFIADWAREWIERFDSYTEFSPSGTGMHVFARGALEGSGRHRDSMEVYDRNRFFTFTGHRVPGTRDTIEERQDVIDDLYARLSPPTKAFEHSMALAVSTIVLSDKEILERAHVARNGASFDALWQGDLSDYGDDDSRADMALCCHLAFWVGPDAKRIDHLFRQSVLYRAKWDAKRGKETYGSGTIKKALGLTHTYYNPDPIVMPPPVVTSNGHHHPEPTKGPFPLTDLGNAERLVARYGQDLHYCFSSKKWYVWRGSFWKENETGQINRYAKATVRAIYDEIATVEDPNERKALARHAARSEANGRINAMIEIAMSEKGIPIEVLDLDAGPWLLNVANGTINLKTGELHEHDRRDLISKIIPIVYEPNAHLPLWDNFLVETTGNHPELIAFLQRSVGYSLTGDTREEKLFFVHGPSRSGKSTFLDAIKMALGDYGMTANFESFLTHNNASGPNQDIAELAGARFVRSIEVDEGKRLAEGLVKTLTGGDSVRARFLYGREFEFLPAFKLWLAANASPKARADDDAIWNRIVRIPFIHVVPPEKRDPRVKLALKNVEIAGPALLAWAVKGCLAWQRDGLMIPAEVKASSEDYRLEVDGLAGFIDDCCVLETNAWAWSSVLVEEYERWSRANNEKKVLRGKSFGARLKARGCTSERREKGNLGAVRGWKGIRILNDDE